LFGDLQYLAIFAFRKNEKTKFVYEHLVISHIRVLDCFVVIKHIDDFGNPNQLLNFCILKGEGPGGNG
jgi:hypothetical protein